VRPVCMSEMRRLSDGMQAVIRLRFSMI
jgi:hypothetical protein